MQAKNRVVSLDILRISCMFLIVLTHGMIWGMPFQTPKSTLWLNNVLYPLFSALTSFSVNCFVLISGYFLSKSYSYKFTKAFKIWLQTLFYSVLFWCVFRFVLNRTDSSFVSSALPIANDLYWFVTQYLILLVLSPFLARFCDSLDKKTYQALLLLLFFLTGSIIMEFPFGKLLFHDSRTPLFLFLFMIAGYIARYDLPTWLEENSGKLFITILVIQWGGGLFLNQWHQETGYIYGAFSTSGGGLSLFSSTALLIWTRKQDWNQNKVALSAASAAPFVFGVYLIHDNLFVRPFLWEKMDVYRFWDSWLFFPVLLVICTGVFLTCLLLDAIRAAICKLPSSLVKRRKQS